MSSSKISRRGMFRLMGGLAAASALQGVAFYPSSFYRSKRAQFNTMKTIPLPDDYAERVYAGVLGKLVGVFLGRPFEGWRYRDILNELGEITGYVNDQFNRPLVLTDDDVSGTFSFLRALQDYDYRRDLTPAQIGQTWLNYLIEKRTTLWWGGMGNSTEHTAYLRLKDGIEAPASGSIAINGKIVAEQIGAQIFIDGWAMVAPGDPDLAADLARRAGSVSHDGEAVYGAQVLAAMEALAFVESDIEKLLDTGIRYIPADSIIRRLIDDVRTWHAAEPDWHKTRQKIEATYGYDKYLGVCHMVPNHALIMMALLYGGGNFQRSLTIVNTSGWDTDCNSGNVACLLGIRNGLAAFDGYDWRGPLNDRFLISTADGGRSVTDAVTETYQIVNAGRALQKQPALKPKGGARFHFELPGATQGFTAESGLTLENVTGHSQTGTRSLALRYSGAGNQVTAITPTFELTDASALPPYALSVSPTLYGGQTVRVGIEADAANTTPVTCRLIAHSYSDSPDQPRNLYGTTQTFQPGEAAIIEWKIVNTSGEPIGDVGIVVNADADATVYLDSLGWDGAPDVHLGRPTSGDGDQWRRAWVNAVDHWDNFWSEAYRLVQDEGRGLIIQGTREWTDYDVSVGLTPHMLTAAGLAARVQGLRRYYALLLRHDGTVALVKSLDGEKELGRAPFKWQEEEMHTLRLQVAGAHIRASVDGQVLFDLEDTDRPLLTGAIGLVIEEGTVSASIVAVSPPEGTNS